VKLKVVHDLCGREILVRQILDSQGHCPWDGKAFSGDYTAVLAEILEDAELAGSTLENALEKLAGMSPAFTLEEATLIKPLQEQLGSLNRRPSR